MRIRRILRVVATPVIGLLAVGISWGECLIVKRFLPLIPKEAWEAARNADPLVVVVTLLTVLVVFLAVVVAPTYGYAITNEKLHALLQEE